MPSNQVLNLCLWPPAASEWMQSTFLTSVSPYCFHLINQLVYSLCEMVFFHLFRLCKALRNIPIHSITRDLLHLPTVHLKSKLLSQFKLACNFTYALKTLKHRNTHLVLLLYKTIWSFYQHKVRYLFWGFALGFNVKILLPNFYKFIKIFLLVL